MRTITRIQAVYIQTDIYLAREAFQKPIALIFPGLPSEQPPAYIMHKMGLDPSTRVENPISLLRTIIPDADLNKFSNLRKLVQHVVHNGSMGILETFISLPQITVRIDLDQSKVVVLFDQRPEVSQGRTVITPDQQ